MNSEEIPAALGRVPSGLFVITYLAGAAEQAMLASWIQQCSFDPPMISVAVKQGRGLADWLPDGAEFMVNILAEGQTDLVSHFGRGQPLDQLPDRERRLRPSPGCAPALTDALAVLRCQVTGRTTPGDHYLYFARILAGQQQGEARPWFHVRKNGLKY